MIKEKTISTETLPSGIVKQIKQLYNTGSCQCYRDCDCYKDRGFVKEPYVTYNHKYETEAAAIQQLKEKERQEEIISTYKNEALIWKTALSFKDFCHILNECRKINKDKVFRKPHKECFNDNDTMYKLHRVFLKHVSDTKIITK